MNVENILGYHQVNFAYSGEEFLGDEASGLLQDGSSILLKLRLCAPGLPVYSEQKALVCPSVKPG